MIKSMTAYEKQLKSLGAIEESGGRLLALISNILDMAKIGTDQLELHITPVHVEQICGASLGAVKQAAQKSDCGVYPRMIVL